MKTQENFFRKIFKRPVDSLLLKLPWPNINPVHITYFTIITTILSISFYSYNKVYLFLTFLLITLMLDWVDGTIARKHNRISTVGEILDKIADRISEFIFFLVIWVPGLVLVFYNILITFLYYVKSENKLLKYIGPLNLRLGLFLFFIYKLI